MDFYTTAAQVIPTLFIAMALGGGILTSKPNLPAADAPARWWRPTRDDYVIFTLAVAFIMVQGEACALFALSVGERSGLMTAGAWMGVLAGLLGVALPVVRSMLAHMDRRSRPFMVAVMAVCAVLLIALAAAAVLRMPVGVY